MKPENLEAIYELSPMQQGMLFDSIYAPKSGVYCIHIQFSLQGKVNISAFRRAWKQVINRYPVLRTSYYWEELDKFLQVVHKQINLPLEQHDWRGLSPTEQEEKFQTFLEADRNRGFDLTQAPLMRLFLIQMSDASYQFVLSYHHLIMDGWSTALLFNDLFSFYKAYCQGQSLRLAPNRPYSDYIGWLQQQDLNKAEVFWRQKLEDFTAPTAMGVGSAAADSLDQGRDFSEYENSLSAELTTALQTFARQHQLTLNTLLQGAWSLLLSRYSGEKDVVYGTVVSGRPPELAGANSMVGLFINTLPVRVQLSSDEPLSSWLKRLQDEQLEARQYEYSPLVKVQEWSGVSGGQPLFESIFVFENYPSDASSSENEELKISNFQVAERVTFPISLWSRLPIGQDAEVSLRMRYDTHRFDSETIKLMLDHLQTLLSGFIVDPDQSLASLSLLTELERRRLLIEWNDTAFDYPKDAGIHDLFAAQVKKTPEKTAVFFQDQSITYQQLNQRADQLAAHLQQLGVGPDVFVGICLNRSIDMIVAVLAVMKAGGAYLPLDPAYPVDRLSYMMADSQSPVLITESSLNLTESLSNDLPQKPAVICIDAEWDTISANGTIETAAVNSQNLAYIIYTSGSTGKPKGVQIPHRAAVNFLLSMQKEPGLTAEDTLFSVTTLSFDIAVLELYLPLITGAQLIIVPRATAYDGRRLAQELANSKTTVMQATPVTWRMLVDAGWQGSPNLKVLCGGEAMPPDLAEDLLTRCDELWNMYGPTETTVWSTIRQVVAGKTAVNIGRPIANTSIYILDEHMQPVPRGVAGELLIGGDGLARGYLDRPELTAERFIPNPFNPQERLYRTGDLARYLPNGEIDFLGRMDFQVKIRGFRIELGEIEAAITSHPAVSETVTIVREDEPGNKQLVAYLIANDTNNPPPVSELQSYIGQQLPDYMVPTAYVFLDSYPQTPNRKVDRKALPTPNLTRNELDPQFVAPRNPVEEAVSLIMANVLQMDKVGALDNFFMIGGHSLLATRVLARISDTFKYEITLRDFFESPTVAHLAELLVADPTQRQRIEKTAVIHVKLSNLSDEEIAQMLQEKSKVKA